MNLIKQSTAVTLLIGPFLDDGDGKSAETGLTISQADVRLSKNGGNMAQKSDSTACTHDELGYYTCPLNTTDTNTLGILRVMVHESGALPVWYDCQVVTANVYDTLCSTDSLDVNVTAISGDSTAADNLESAADGTGYNLGGGDIVAASVTAGVTASTVSDKTGYALTAAYDAAKSAAPETGGNIAAIKTKTDNLPASPAAVGSAMTLDAAETGTGLTAVPWNASWDAEVQSECADALSAYDPPTATEMTSAFTEIKGATWSSATDTLEAIRDRGDSAWTTATGFATASDITTAHSTTDGKIDAVDDYVDTEVTAIKAVTDKLDTALELDGAVYRYTTNALEQASGTGATAQQVWEYTTRSLTDKAGFGLADDAITSAKFDETTAYPLTSADTGATAVARTGADSDTLEALSDQLDGLATDGEVADAILDEALSGHTTAGTLGKAIADILADTGTDGVQVAGIKAAALADLFDTDSGTTYASAVSGSVVKEIADNAGGSALTAGAIADAVWDEATADHSGVGSTGAAITAAGSAGDPWATALPGSYGAGTAGKIVGDNINAPIGTVDTVVDAIKSKTDHLPDADAGASGGVFIAGTNAATEIRSSSGTALTLQSTGASGRGLLIQGHALSSGVLIVGGKYAAGVKIKGGETSGEGVNISTTNGDGLLIAANGSGKQDINADTEVTAIKAVTDKLDTALEVDGAVYRYTTNALEQAPSGGLDAAGVRTAVGLASANLDTQLGALPTAAENADAVWNETVADHSGVGSTGAALSAVKDIPTNAELATALASADDAVLAAIAALTEAGVKKNTALSGFTFYMTDSTNHEKATGLTVTAERSLDGAAFAACANAVAELSDGCYKIDLADTDLNADVVALKFTATDADDLVITIRTSA